MEKVIRYCHICKKPVLSSQHWKIHSDIPINVRKMDFYLYNFPVLKNKEYLEDLYLNKKYSLPMIKKLANNIDLKALCFVFNQYGIKIRSVKEAQNTQETKNRIKETCIKKYGKPNCLSKGTEPYKKKQKTILDKYGVENIFQIVDQFIIENGTKYTRSKISKLNIQFSNILDKLNIQYETEFKIKYFDDNKNMHYKFYDFHILNTNILIEVNGNYWHANPEIYNKNDIFQFPRSKITAEDIWKMDKYKKYIAKVNNFIVLYFWEKEIKELSEDVLAKKIKDCIDIENTKKLATI